MWFASIWIFTLRLPWELGADFFARQLIDFDPASNTLSWRWVAGLHTRGKPYVARADNIARYTEGLFDPAGQLDEAPAPLAEDETPPRTGLPRQEALPGAPCALLLHEDDLCPETLIVPGGVAAIAVLRLEPQGSERQRIAARVSCEDARVRAALLLGAPALVLDGVDDIVAWADGRPVVTPYAPVGPVAEALSGIAATRLLRPWDESLWPYCAKGYFQLKARI
jgi:deoxyribodipyrimidine photo-lyase